MLWVKFRFFEAEEVHVFSHVGWTQPLTMTGLCMVVLPDDLVLAECSEGYEFHLALGLRGDSLARVSLRQTGGTCFTVVCRGSSA